MNTLRTRLFSHLKSPEDISAYDTGDAFCNMFDESVEKVFEWDEQDHQGTVMVVYKFEGIYFYGYASYGSCSGCDEWMAGDESSRSRQLQRMFDHLDQAENLWEICLNRYHHPRLRYEWIELMKSHCCLDQYLEHENLCDSI